MILHTKELLFSVFKNPVQNAGKILAILATVLLYLTAVLSCFLHPGATDFIWVSPFVMATVGFVGLFWIFRVEHSCQKKNRDLQTGVDSIERQDTNLKAGEEILIRAGEVIPRDGIIKNGMSSLDESAITGSHRTVFKSKNDHVFATTINRDSDLLIEVTGLAENDLIARLHRMHTESTAEKPRTQNTLITYQWSMIILALSLAAGIFGYHYLLTGLPVEKALTLALPFLFLPPLTLNVMHGLLFEHLFHASFAQRLLTSRSANLEKLARVQSIFFNKTGTLTKGDFVYSQSFIERGTNTGDFLTILFSLEAQCDHPLAWATETHPWYAEITKLAVRGFQNHPGLGVCGHVKLTDRRHEVFAAAGNLRFLKRHRFNISRDMKLKADELEEMGETVVLVAFDRQVRGIMSFSDLLRKDISKVLRRLQKLGLETSLITGDTENTVTHVVGKLGIKKVYSRCTPEEKASRIEKERENGASVAMVARDLDNSSAMEKADLSISFNTGTDFPDHHSDILILGRDIKKLSWLFEQAIISSRLIKSHIYLHAGYFAVAGTLAALGFLPGWLAVSGSILLSVGIYPFVRKYVYVD